MARVEQTSKEYFKTLSILHLALTFSPLPLTAIVLYLRCSNSSPFQISGLDTVFLVLVLMFTFFGVLSSYLIYRYKLRRLKEENNLKLKMASYRGVFILRCALLESPALFAVIAVLITSNPIFFVITGMMVIFMFLFRPRKDGVIVDLELSQEEIMIIENPDAIIAEFSGSID